MPESRAPAPRTVPWSRELSPPGISRGRFYLPKRPLPARSQYGPVVMSHIPPVADLNRSQVVGILCRPSPRDSSQKSAWRGFQAIRPGGNAPYPPMCPPDGQAQPPVHSLCRAGIRRNPGFPAPSPETPPPGRSTDVARLLRALYGAPSRFCAGRLFSLGKRGIQGVLLPRHPALSKGPAFPRRKRHQTPPRPRTSTRRCVSRGQPRYPGDRRRPLLASRRRTAN